MTDPRSVARRYVNRKQAGGCPIQDSAYGGLPPGGNIDRFTEYLVGASRTAQAVHCLLGSLGRSEGEDTEHRNLKSEFAHAEDELEIIEHVRDEYSKDLYVDRLVHKDADYLEKMATEIETSVAELRDRAERMKQSVGSDLHPPIYRQVAEDAYEVVIALCEALLSSLDRSSEGTVPLKSNAFEDSTYRRRVDELRSSMEDLRSYVERQKSE